MKKLIVFGFVMVLATLCHAQDVTKFLGIPVDGTKSAMIQKLKEKGYTYDAKEDWLEGEFNGRDVILSVVTNNNKVYRIMVRDAYGVSETEIKIRFNTLCRQFEKNERYSSFVDDQTIPESDNISYEMMVHKKRYEASYIQDNLDFDKALLSFAKEKVTEQEFAELSNSEIANLKSIVFNEYEDEFKHYCNVRMLSKCVWFTIMEVYGKYYICLYYDNEYNKANGEDL